VVDLRQNQGCLVSRQLIFAGLADQCLDYVLVAVEFVLDILVLLENLAVLAELEQLKFFAF
jgi:hypothetical protein